MVFLLLCLFVIAVWLLFCLFGLVLLFLCLFSRPVGASAVGGFCRILFLGREFRKGGCCIGCSWQSGCGFRGRIIDSVGPRGCCCVQESVTAHWSHHRLGIARGDCCSPRVSALTLLFSAFTLYSFLLRSQYF